MTLSFQATRNNQQCKLVDISYLEQKQVKISCSTRGDSSWGDNAVNSGLHTQLTHSLLTVRGTTSNTRNEVYPSFCKWPEVELPWDENGEMSTAWRGGLKIQSHLTTECWGKTAKRQWLGRKQVPRALSPAPHRILHPPWPVMRSLSRQKARTALEAAILVPVRCTAPLILQLPPTFAAFPSKWGVRMQ